MAAAHRYTNLAAVVLPAAGLIYVGALTWGSGLASADVIALAVAYLLCGIGITVGFHRLLTHHSFVAPRWLELILAVLGTASAQGPVIMWVADHRQHHAFADRDGDPHSPHTDQAGLFRGLLHAHIGWILNRHGQADWHTYAPEMVDDRALRRISRWAGPIVLAALAATFAAGWVAGGSLASGLRMLLWAGLVRIFLFQHFASFAVNSLCHTFGRRRYSTSDRSTNLAWLAIPSLGEAWHHNHHAFPRSADHGLRRCEIDLAGSFIRLLELAGLARDVVHIPPQRERARLTASDASNAGTSGSYVRAKPDPQPAPRRLGAMDVADDNPDDAKTDTSWPVGSNEVSPLGASSVALGTDREA